MIKEKNNLSDRSSDKYMTSESVVRLALEESVKVQRNLLAKSTGCAIDIANLLIDRFRHGGILYLIGNGGSAAEAQHIATEFIVRFKRKRDPLPAVALSSDSAVITALGNDFDFKTIFSNQVQALARPNDVIVALSTSGSSPNIVEAIRVANKLGVTTVGFTGNHKGDLTRLANICLEVPSGDTQRIQEAHLIIWHIICDLVDLAFSGVKATTANE